MIAASGSSHGSIKIWDLERRSRQKTIEGMEKVNAVAFASDGSFFASGGDGGEIRIWNAETWVEKRAMRTDAMVLAVAFLPSGVLATGTVAGSIDLWDPLQGKRIARFDAHKEQVLALAATPKGDLLASGSSDGRIKVWAMETRRELLNLGAHEPREIRSLACGPDGKTLVSGDANGAIQIWNLQKGQEIASWTGHDGAVKSLVFLPSETRLVSAGLGRKVKWWASHDHGLAHECQGDEHCSVESMALAADGKSLVLAFGTGLLKVVHKTH
jgi:WD40 repeat protein